MDLAANERLQQGGARALEPDWSDPPERGEGDGGGTLSWRRSDGQLSAMGKVKVIPPQQNIQSPSRLVVYFIMLLRTKLLNSIARQTLTTPWLQRRLSEGGQGWIMRAN